MGKLLNPQPSTLRLAVRAEALDNEALAPNLQRESLGIRVEGRGPRGVEGSGFRV